ncbi:hypothetical protein PHMEG_00034830 [Phytophthora megakarya]|uniref:Uncharacterized protein n=1 Tax=Phytophthora megakarya TaxID=4795 RepID=A0A225UQB3_9STRA|nr:hypothetical protein PHMEG_00034830 [Phytophthora megakarya]
MSKTDMSKGNFQSLKFSGNSLFLAACDNRLSRHQPRTYALWRLVDKQYGLSNAAGVGGLAKRFDEIVNADFKSGSAQAFVGKSEIFALASGKLVNHVEAAPAKPKSKVLGKRKATDGPVCDVHYNYGAMKYHYCGGEHNKMNDSRLSAKLRKPPHEPTPKMTGKGKGKGKKARREIPLEECQQPTDVTADACDATLATLSSPAPSISPPAGTWNPPKPERDQVMLGVQGSDEPMDSVFAQRSISVNGGHVKDAADQNGPLQPGEQQIALNLETMRPEDKARVRLRVNKRSDEVRRA